MHAAAGGAAAAGESRAAGGQGQIEEAQGVRDKPDGLLGGALGGGRDDEEWE